MNFTEDAGEQTFTFTANTTWSVSVAETSGGATWCTVSPASGNAGEQIVTVKVDANDTYDDRSVTLTLKAGTATETFVVTQKQQNALLLTADKYEVDQKGGTITLEVKANVDYTATISELCKDWITEAANTKGLTTTTKSYQISANEDGKKREGTIVFSDGTLTETVHVYQAGGNIILLTENEYYADAAGEEMTVELRSNCEYEVVMPSVDWIHEATTRAMSSHTLRYTIDPNETYDNREAIIVYRDAANSTVDTLTVIQAQKDAIVLMEKKYTVSPEGETIEVKLASNTEYTITIASNAKSWITEVEDAGTKALVESKRYFQIAKSNSTSERRGTITFSSGKGISEVVTVIQEKPVLELTSDEEMQITAEKQTLEVTLKANVDFNVTTEADWISRTGTAQTENGQTVTFSVSENTESSPRSAEIVFSNENFRLEKSLTVTQQGETLEVTAKTAGTLEQLVPNYREIQTLKINGPLNGTDIVFLRSMLKDYKLTSLDLAGASIVEGGSSYYSYYDVGGPVKLYTSNNRISNRMFYECSNLVKIILPDNTEEIGEWAFGSCTSLSEVNIPNSVVTIGNLAFYSCNLRDVKIPEGVIKIGYSAFGRCKKLTKVDIANSVTEIGNGAFDGCESLMEINIPNNVTEISDSAFKDCI